MPGCADAACCALSVVCRRSAGVHTVTGHRLCSSSKVVALTILSFLCQYLRHNSGPHSAAVCCCVGTGCHHSVILADSDMPRACMTVVACDMVGQVRSGQEQIAWVRLCRFCRACAVNCALGSFQELCPEATAGSAHCKSTHTHHGSLLSNFGLEVGPPFGWCCQIYGAPCFGLCSPYMYAECWPWHTHWSLCTAPAFLTALGVAVVRGKFCSMRVLLLCAICSVYVGSTEKWPSCSVTTIVTCPNPTKTAAALKPGVA